MNQKQMWYVVVYSGEYDSHSEDIKFVTEDEKTAQKWVVRFNVILKKARDHYSLLYSKTMNNIENPSDEQKNDIILSRYYDVMGINYAAYYPVNVK